MDRSSQIPSAILAGGVILALAVYFSMTGKLPAPEVPRTNLAAIASVTAGDHILGNPAAKATIVEYTDFDCAYCKDFHATLHELIANEGSEGSVSWVLRQLPLTELHPNARKHAEAAECAAIAGGNDGFWRFADRLFAAQPADPARYGALALQSGVPSDAFTACYQDAANTVGPRIDAERASALAAGARGTPFSVLLIPGQKPVVLDGAYSYDALRATLSGALDAASSSSAPSESR